MNKVKPKSNFFHKTDKFKNFIPFFVKIIISLSFAIIITPMATSEIIVENLLSESSSSDSSEKNSEENSEKSPDQQNQDTIGGTSESEKTSSEATHQLVGQWKSNDELYDLPPLTFIFTPPVDSEGKLYTIYEYGPTPFAEEGRYKLETITEVNKESGCDFPVQRITLIINDKQTYSTFFRFDTLSSKEELQIQLIDAKSGIYHSCDFLKMRNFERISTEYSIPNNIKVFPFEAPTSEKTKP
jgi:hypothetical protein